MEFIKRYHKTILFGVMIFLILFGVFKVIFGPKLMMLADERDQKRDQLEAYEELIRQEGQYKKLLEPFNLQSKDRQTGEVVLQDWVNTLLHFASENGMTFEKIEPDKLRTKDREQEMRINLAFKGDIQKLLYFIQYLMKTNPLANIERMKISQTEDKKDYFYELVLEKALL